MQLTFDESLGEASALKEAGLTPPVPPVEPSWYTGRVLSHSSVSSYQTCPQKWKFRYVDKIPEKPRSYFSFGKSVHAALEFLFSDLSKELPSLDQVLANYREGWLRDGYDTVPQEKWFFQEGERIIKGFYAKHKNEFQSVFQIEYRFTFSLEGVPLTGFIDRIDKRPNGRLAIIDYKTGKAFDKTRVRQDPQLTLYQIACRTLFGLEVESVSLYHLNSLTPLTVPAHSAELEKKVITNVVEAAKGIQAANFTPKPDPAGACQYCDYMQICPAFEGKNISKRLQNGADPDLRALVDRYAKIDERMKALLNERADVEAKLDAHSKRTGETVLDGHHYKVHRLDDGAFPFRVEEKKAEDPK